jgi:hypothetical protein
MNTISGSSMVLAGDRALAGDQEWQPAPFAQDRDLAAGPDVVAEN